MKNRVKTGGFGIVGRTAELSQLSRIGLSKRAAIVIVYGRRRVGKTTLIEHAYRERRILKIEGVESGPKAKQLETALLLLAQYVNDPTIAKLKFTRWLEFFEYIARFLDDGVHTLYLEELQWLASYDDELVSDFKLVWDNRLSKNSNLVVVLCGSSPSFMINNVVKSKALYGRSQHEIHVEPFTLREAVEYFGDSYSLDSVMDSYLSVGGIPEYLSYLRASKSSYLELCNQSFRRQGYFLNECERVFVSSLANNNNYRKIIEILAKQRFSTRPILAERLSLDSGGTLSHLLFDLEMSGFIRSYVPFDKKEGSKLVRYEISDQYLQFYFRFIAPAKKRIAQNAYAENSTKALNLTDYQQWLGYSFERWCRHNHALLAKYMGFSNVQYDVGPYFSKKTPVNFQIDLIFSRADKVLTICEIKYTKAPVSKKVIKEFEQKMESFVVPPRHSVQRVLISAGGTDIAVKNAGFFDDIIELKDLI